MSATKCIACASASVGPISRVGSIHDGMIFCRAVRLLDFGMTNNPLITNIETLVEEIPSGATIVLPRDNTGAMRETIAPTIADADPGFARELWAYEQETA